MRYPNYFWTGLKLKKIDDFSIPLNIPDSYSNYPIFYLFFSHQIYCFPLPVLPRNSVSGKHKIVPLRACLQGDRVTLESG